MRFPCSEGIMLNRKAAFAGTSRAVCGAESRSALNSRGQLDRKSAREQGIYEGFDPLHEIGESPTVGFKPQRAVWQPQ